MHDLLARFRRGAQSRPGLRYSAELRRLAVSYARLARERGDRRRRIAGDLGVSEWSLARWLRRETEAPAAARAAVFEVAIVDDAPPSRAVVVAPSGLRVEGLSVREIVAVLEALR